MKKYSTLLLSIVTSTIVMSGCGSSSNPSNNTGNTSATGTGYYIDSAISGINYICGSKSGVTGDDGSFTFEEGKSCTFKLGDITLRSVTADNLKDKVKIVEDRVEVAQLLQTLDVDGNATNGITIKPEVIKAMKDNGITKLPESADKIAEVFEAVKGTAGYQGKFITADKAQEHLKKSQSEVLKELLAGNTFYNVSKKDHYLDEISFNKDVTSFTWKTLKGNDIGESDTETIHIEGNKFINVDGDSYVISSQTSDYIIISGKDSSSRFYFDKIKAEEYFDSLTNSDNTKPKFSTNLIKDKTFWIVNKNSSNGSSAPETCILEFHFTDSTVTKKEWSYKSPTNWIAGCNEDFGDINNLPYKITDDNKIELQDADKWWFKLDTMNDSSYDVVDPDGSSKWYFTKNKANEVASH